MMKVSLEIVDDEGVKTNVTFEGDFAKERLIQLIEALDFQPTPRPSSRSPSQGPARDLINEALTAKDRLKFFLRYEYPNIWFKSVEVKERYGLTYGHMPLSTISTYLGRMYREGILERRGTRAQREYRYISMGAEEHKMPQDMRSASSL
ncbi:MAG: hypothetical protein BME93_04900 [Methanosarcinales archaeon Met12]|nr:MAG: hypothetical protein BME93_04900 [Methanosarcinales archaeon Met12]